VRARMFPGYPGGAGECYRCEVSTSLPFLHRYHRTSLELDRKYSFRSLYNTIFRAFIIIHFIISLSDANIMSWNMDDLKHASRQFKQIMNVIVFFVKEPYFKNRNEEKKSYNMQLLLTD